MKINDVHILGVGTMWFKLICLVRY